MNCRHCQADLPQADLAGHLVEVHHVRLCVLCARRGRATEVDALVVCSPCKVRIDDQLTDIVRLAADAAAWVEPATTGNFSRAVPGSRPPLNVEAIEPELILVRPWPDDPEEMPLLDLLESWARLIMDERRMSKYGPWSLQNITSKPSSNPADRVNGGPGA